MKVLLNLISVIIILNSCKEAKNQVDNKIKIIQQTFLYDSLRFNTKYIPDTAGCWWIFKDREIIDTLTFQKAFLKVTSDTFLVTKNYRRLFLCPKLPRFLLPDDTVLISGYIYRIYADEGTGGNPTYISRIDYLAK